jgi:hypothetical protein
MATDEAELNICEQITRIDHAIAETTKYVAEQRQLEARARNFDRHQWQLVAIAIIARAALFSAASVF